MLLKKLLRDRFGSILVSVILGLGLAAIFRKACTGDGCVVIKAPSTKDIDNYVYQIERSCYKYTPQVVSCDKFSPPAKTGGGV
jgi:hypothetical protein